MWSVLLIREEEESMTHLEAGRLGSVDMKIEDDPRTDPRIAETIALDNMPIRVAPNTYKAN